MKRILSLAVAMSLCFSLAACGSLTRHVVDQVTEGASSKPAESVSQITTAPDFSEDESEPNEVEASSSEETSEPTATATATPAPADLGEVVSAETSTVENPIPLNTWAGISKYSTIDDKYHTVNVRVTGVVTDAAQIQAMVDEHNKFASDWKAIDLNSEDWKVPQDVQWCAVTYEVQIPEDFPSESWGISSPKIDWSCETLTGGGIPTADGTSVYIGLGMANDQLYSEQCNDDTTYLPGNTYKLANLYPMVKGYTDYTFCTNYVPDGQDLDTGKLIDVFFAIS